MSATSRLEHNFLYWNYSFIVCTCLTQKGFINFLFGYSSDIEKLKKLVLHNPVTLTLTEVEGDLKDDIVPTSVQQFKVLNLRYSICIFLDHLSISKILVNIIHKITRNLMFRHSQALGRLGCKEFLCLFTRQLKWDPFYACSTYQLLILYNSCNLQLYVCLGIFRFNNGLGEAVYTYTRNFILFQLLSMHFHCNQQYVCRFHVNRRTNS